MGQKMKSWFLSPDAGAGDGGGAPAASPSTPATPSAPPSPDVAPDANQSLVSDGARASYVGPDGAFAEGWTGKLPEDLAGARDSLGKFKTVTDLVRAYDSANKLVGRKGVLLPTPESSSEEISAFRKTMGVPESADGYAAAVKPETFPEGIQWSDEIAKSYYEVAHRHNIPAAAMKDLIALNMKQREFEIQAQAESVMETKHRGLSHLRAIWGSDFDRNLGLAQRAAALGGANPDSYGWRDPEVVKLVVRMANMMGEDKFVGAGGALPVGAADLRSRAQDIIRNPSNPLHQRYREGDADVQAQVRNMLKQASNGK